ncbi:MAG: GAF domain-containing sensor histidine kinase [Verrucomicrobiota bacterium]
MLAIESKAIFEKFIPQIGVLPVNDLLAALFGEVAALLQVERVGYSRMETDRSGIQQEVQFHLTGRKSETSGLPKLLAKDYPGYFAALETPPGVIVSHDVLRDERLKEFRESYFKPLKITSMLDVPVHRAGQLYGVICHEQVGPKRRWTDEEVAAAASFAHLVALAVETDERQKAQAALREALEREKEMTELKTNFVSLVSHEFRTPLGVIVSAADILENYFDRLQPQQRAGHLQDIRYSAQQMSGLMEEVLLLGKVESGRMVCRREPLQLADLCQRIVDEQLSVTNRKCPIQLEVEEMATEAEGDEGLLRHILNNLISNAVKYSPAAMAVQFRVRREGTLAIFEIEDRGIGIEAADQKHLFIAFQRGKNVGAIPGTGLGLVIVKRCVELHGGVMTFQSRVNQGTRFVVRIALFAEKPRREKSVKGQKRK